MPSAKGKRQSKRPSEVSGSRPCSSPRTPASLDSEISDDRLLQTLEVASDIFPSLIGKTAFVGRFTDIGNSARGNTIWLSESAMVSSSFTHDSLVSVSSPSNSKFQSSFPLRSLSDGFAKHIGVHFRDGFTDEAGNFFALAKICSSIKVSKNEVRLSSDLASTMGYPTLGGPIFVYATQSENLVVTKAIPLPVFECGELYLELVHSRASTMANVSSRVFSETSSGLVNGSVGSASPRTPMNQIKASYSVKSHLASPVGGTTVNTLPSSNGHSIDSSDITKLLGEDGSSKQLLDRCAAHWLYNRCLLRGNLVTVPILSELCTFRVVGANRLSKERSNYHRSDSDLPPAVSEPPEQFIQSFAVQRETKVCLALENPEKQGPAGVHFDIIDDKADTGEEKSKLGGLSKEYEILQDIIASLSMDILSSYGFRKTKGVLLHGPPGTGKTSLAQVCVRDAGLKIFPVCVTELVSKYHGESERSLHQVFEAAQKAAPAVVFMDDVDALAPRRNEGGDELSHRMVATLLDLMDGISTTDGILVIGTTSRPDSIDSALRRPGRFGREIEIGVPSPKQRIEILHSLLDDFNHSLSESQVENLALTTHGFVGADLAALCNEAARICLKNYIKAQETSRDSDVVGGAYCLNDRGDNLTYDFDSASSSMSNGVILYENIDGVPEELTFKIGFECFETAKTRVIPSAMREVVLEVPEVRWEDVGGQAEVKRQLKEAVEWPQKHGAALKRIGTRPPRGVLMFGPPGCSKTLLARAVASQARLNFLAVKGPELFSKWVGDSEKGVRNLFATARANAPSIIFFDEIDGLASIRGHENDGVSVSDRVMSQLLVEMDGLHERLAVTVIAATNRPDKIDSALLRPGRFDRVLYVGPPNESDRAQIFRIHLRKIPCSSDVSIEDIASRTQGYTGADISSVCREAALNAVEENENASEITMQDLRIGKVKVLPSTSHISYGELSKEFERLVLST